MGLEQHLCLVFRLSHAKYESLQVGREAVGKGGTVPDLGQASDSASRRSTCWRPHLEAPDRVSESHDTPKCKKATELGVPNLAQ